MQASIRYLVLGLAGVGLFAGCAVASPARGAAVLSFEDTEEDELEIADLGERPARSSSAGFRFTYMYGPTWPMGPASRLARLYEEAFVPPQPSFFWGARFQGGQGFDVNLRMQIVTLDGDLDEFAFPLSFLYHLTLTPRARAGAYLAAGVTFFNLVADGYYHLGVGPSVALGVEFMQNKPVRIPLELRYELLPSALRLDPTYDDVDFGGMTLAVGLSI